MSLVDQPFVYRRGVSGKLSPFTKIQFALKLLEKRKQYKEKYGHVHSKLTYNAIANAVGVHSPNTIARWDHLDMSYLAVNTRLANKAAKRKFTIAEEKVLAGWVIFKDLTLESSTTLNFTEFVLTYFGRSVSASFISKFMSRNHLSLKQVGGANRNELLDTTIDTAVNFLESFERVICQYGFRPDQIKVFDKTYLMTSPWHKFVKHMSPSGRNKPRKQTCARGDGMTLFLLTFAFFHPVSFLFFSVAVIIPANDFSFSITSFLFFFPIYFH